MCAPNSTLSPQPARIPAPRMTSSRFGGLAGDTNLTRSPGFSRGAFIDSVLIALAEEARREIVQRVAPHLPLVCAREAHEDRLESLPGQIVERLLLEWQPGILGATRHVQQLQTCRLLRGTCEQVRHDDVGTDRRRHATRAAEHAGAELTDGSK